MPGFENIKKTVNLSIYSLLRAIDGVRTRDPDLGKVVLYQLSHCRIFSVPLTGTIHTILRTKRNVNTFFYFFIIIKMSTLNSTFFHVFIVLPFCTIRSLFYCIFSLLGSAIVRLPLLPASHAPYFRSYASCFTSSSNSSPAE